MSYSNYQSINSPISALKKVEQEKVVNKSANAASKNIEENEQNAIITTYKGNLASWLKSNPNKTKADYNSLNRAEVDEVHSAMSNMSNEEKQRYV